MIWCEPRVIITVNKVVTGRFAPGETDNITNGYAKIQKIIQKDCRNAENPHCIFRIFAVTARAPAGDCNLTHHGFRDQFVICNSSRPCGGQQLFAQVKIEIEHYSNNSRPCGGQQLNALFTIKQNIVTTRAPAGDSNISPSGEIITSR